MTTTDNDHNDHNRSISELIAMHGRERLFVHPLLWTQRQLHLLGCSVVDGGTLTVCAVPPRPASPVPAPTAAQRHMAEMQIDSNKARCLARGNHVYGKGWSLVGLLKVAGCYTLVAFLLAGTMC